MAESNGEIALLNIITIIVSNRVAFSGRAEVCRNFMQSCSLILASLLAGLQVQGLVVGVQTQVCSAKLGSCKGGWLRFQVGARAPGDRI